MQLNISILIALTRSNLYYNSFKSKFNSDCKPSVQNKYVHGTSLGVNQQFTSKLIKLFGILEHLPS